MLLTDFCTLLYTTIPCANNTIHNNTHLVYHVWEDDQGGIGSKYTCMHSAAPWLSVGNRSSALLHPKHLFMVMVVDWCGCVGRKRLQPQLGMG